MAGIVIVGLLGLVTDQAFSWGYRVLFPWTERARQGLRAFVGAHTTVDAAACAEIIDLLVLSPTGLKGDDPSPSAYRRRLRALATAAAKLLDAD